MDISLTMKKKNIAILMTILILSTLAVFYACNKVEEPKKESNVSRQVLSFYAGENEDFAVTLEFLEKEKPFVADGITNEVVSTVQLVILPLKVHNTDQYNFALKNQESTYSGTVKGNQFGEYAIDLTIDFVPASITIGEGESACTIDFVNVLDGKLTSQDVINIAESEFAERISQCKESGEYHREIYVKLITGDREHYYYYVSYIGEGVDYWALLINPETGAVVSKK